MVPNHQPAIPFPKSGHPLGEKLELFNNGIFPPLFQPLFWEGALGALGHIKGMGLKRYLSSSKICLSGGRGMTWTLGTGFYAFLWDEVGTWSNQYYPRGKKRTSTSASITMGWSKVEMTNQHSEGALLALTIFLELHLSQNKCSTWNLLPLVKGVRAKVEQKIYKGTFSQCPCKHLSMGLCKRKRCWDAFAIEKTAAPDPS